MNPPACELPDPWGLIAVWGFVLVVAFLVSFALTNLVLCEFLNLPCAQLFVSFCQCVSKRLTMMNLLVPHLWSCAVVRGFLLPVVYMVSRSQTCIAGSCTVRC